MKKIVATSDVANLRSKLMSLASMMLLMVLSVGIVGLFSVWSLSGFHARTQQAVTQVAGIIEQARQSQVHFKTQVQEWKNILLRGHEQAGRVQYQAAFETQALRALELLDQLPSKFDQMLDGNVIQSMKHADVPPMFLTDLPRLKSEVVSMTEQLRELNATHRSALLASQDGGKWDPRAADRAVRGADRRLSDRMDAIMMDLMKTHGDFTALATDAEIARFETLTRVVWASVIVALGLVFLLLWQTLRHPVLAK
jgi:methyl-accepting chemotaxis protein